ncbi:hypothetical protein MPTK1_8g07570 [Marchantia polymorpha subsp. ruderalis]|uniref:Uncharacterized protein n=1 Tax=Marchantia polymorpha TaxID=3197 RepID=A0A2R6XIA4_MARPO|nr:hypothetical protein MARPO_0013s0036 [Marchantia polymorpha]BBN19047.1 hypothetical protein Mp_8g07570 [Marchantia polymorpha subsp. ruderalis]|eukprot:PTQ45799.1 hypothetical protein MARPO_0013s0036 [Marchantia polymorpha]
MRVIGYRLYLNRTRTSCTRCAVSIPYAVSDRAVGFSLFGDRGAYPEKTNADCHGRSGYPAIVVRPGHCDSVHVSSQLHGHT